MVDYLFLKGIFRDDTLVVLYSDCLDIMKILKEFLKNTSNSRNNTLLSISTINLMQRLSIKKFSTITTKITLPETFRSSR